MYMYMYCVSYIQNQDIDKACIKMHNIHYFIKALVYRSTVFNPTTAHIFILYCSMADAFFFDLC